MIEVWKDISKYEGYYQISSFGRVKSLDRKIKSGERMVSLKGKILKQHSNKNSKYLYVNLNKDGKYKSLAIHRLVAEAFIPNPDNLPQVGHRDETRTNNNINNLYWTTNLENSNTPLRKERLSKIDSGKHLEEKTKAKISNKVKQNVGRKFLCEEKYFESLTDLAKYLNIPPTTLSHYVKGDRKCPSTLPYFKELCIDRNN